MERDLTILLVEDDPTECRAINICVDSTDGIRIVGTTNSAKKAFEYLTERLPDAIILDLELHKGSGSGIDLLCRLQDSEIAYTPYILVTTNNMSKITHEKIRNLGVDFIMTKNQEDYSAEYVIGFLLSMKSVIHKNLHNHNPVIPQNTDLSKEEIISKTTRRLQTEFDLIGISPKVIGRKYLCESILIIMENPTPNIGQILANKYKKTDTSIERAMQNAISNAWRKNDVRDLMKYYTAKIDSKRGVPTLNEFIYFYADKMKNGR